MPCTVCKKTGCNARNHGNSRCTQCGKRGHNRRSHQDLKQYPAEASSLPNWIEFASYRTRHSNIKMSQSEVDIAARVLLQCREDAATGTTVLLRKPIDRTVQLTGVGKSTVASISAALGEGQWPEVQDSRRGKHPRLDTSRDLVAKVNDTIDKLHAVGIMTSVNKIRKCMDFHHGIQLADTFTRRLLRRMGYTYGQPNPENIVLAKETQSSKDNRLRYLEQIECKRQQGLKIVYVDESYVNKSHLAARCWLKKGSTIYLPSGKGPRYILVGAGSKDGWLYTKAFRHNDASTDYHKAMNGEHFEEIFTEMCRIGKERLGHCLYLLDNAAYHKRLVDARHRITYWRNLNAQAVKAAWTAGEVPQQELMTGPPLTTKKAIIQFIKENPSQGVLKVDAVAQEYGHEVMMLPPYRPELNAIETAWAVTKNFVADNNEPRMTLDNLGGLIEQGLKEVKVSTWVKLDAKVQEEEAKQRRRLKQEKQRHEAFAALHPDLQFTLSDGESSSSEDEGPRAEEDTSDVEAALEGTSDGLDGNDEPLVASGSTESADIGDEDERTIPLYGAEANTSSTEMADVQNYPEASHSEEDLIAAETLLNLNYCEE